MKTFTVLLLAMTLFACTKKENSGTVRFTLPMASVASLKSESKSVSASGSTNKAWNTNINPTVGSDINCYAVFVGGGDLTSNSCTIGTTAATATTIQFGPYVGFVPAGGEIVLTVPTGQRTIYVAGLRAATTAACTSFVGKEPDSTNLSEPFLIAAQAAVIPSGDSALTITPTLDTSKKVLDCPNLGSGSTTSSKPFGDKRDGSISATATPTPMMAGTETLSSITARSGTSPLASSKIFAASRRITGIATAGDHAGALLTTGTAFTSDHFEVGDEVSWYVAGGSSTLGSPDDSVLGACGGGFYTGRFGTARIAAIPSGNQILLDQSISGAPATIRTTNLSTAPSTQNYCTIVLSRVSSFDSIDLSGGYNLTLQAEPFSYADGTGGFLMVRAESISIGTGSTLTVSGNSTGYQGGAASGTRYQGQGLNSFGTDALNSNYNGGAPGTISSSGGGGGGNGGAGGAGLGAGGSGGGSSIGHCGTVGGLICYPLIERKAFMGGGGGGAGSSAIGGAGGAVVLLLARNVTGPGTLMVGSYGASGSSGSAGSGGGAGGTVGFYNQSSAGATIYLKANGGNGGSGTYSGGGGGGGVVNAVRCLANFSSSLTTQVTGGTGGTAGSNGALNISNDSALCSL